MNPDPEPAPPAASRAPYVRRDTAELEMDLPTGPAAAPAPEPGHDGAASGPKPQAPSGPAAPSRSSPSLAEEPPRPVSAADADEFDLTPGAGGEHATGAPAPASTAIAPQVEARPVGSAVPKLEFKKRTVSVGERLRAPLAILLSALAVALADIAYNRATGSPLMLGPVRPFWIAAPLALFGVGFTLWGLMRDHDE